jgi:glycopeptide antibiotics resistance protein
LQIQKQWFESVFHLSDYIKMALLFIIFGSVFIWAAGLPDWIVAYATGITQFSVWCTLFALIPFSSFWVSLKHQPEVIRPLWAIQTK